MSDIFSGVDSSSACTASTVTCLQNAGISFVGRYYSRTTKIAGKKLTKAEAQLLSKGGLEIVAVYEDAPTSYSYFSEARGTADATGALQQAASVGQPHGSAIYFTVDYDPAPDEIADNITAYFEAINDVFAADGGSGYSVGVYGSGATCASITEAKLADFAWLAQSTGWSGYTEFTEWNIKQGPEQSVCGLNSDTDVGHGGFGAFRVGSTSGT